MTVVVTGFSPAGYKEYGLRFLDTFAQHWPKQVQLIFYTEEPVVHLRGVCQSLWRCDGASAFARRHRENKAVHGRVAQACWTPKDKMRGYSFRTDAFKFYKQILIPEDAACRMGDGEILCWLDADVVTLADVPREFIEGLLGGFDLVYLGRARRHSEIGFWAVRLNPATRRFLNRIAEMYRRDGFLTLPEWHSAFVWDHCRREAEANGLRANNLTPGKDGHVWHQSPLTQFTDHLKGRRKAMGASPERMQR